MTSPDNCLILNVIPAEAGIQVEPNLNQLPELFENIRLPAPYFCDDDTVRPAYPLLDSQGQRLFFRMGRNVYYCPVDSMACNYAILPKPGEDEALSSYYDSTRPFMPAFLGAQTYFYFKHLEGRFDGRYHWGIYKAPLGGRAVQAMDLDQLPGDTQGWNRLGGLRLHGSAALGDEVIFRWNQGGGTYGMYRMHGPTLVPDELHDLIRVDPRRSQISADGSNALYHNRTETSNDLWMVDLASADKTLLGRTNSWLYGANNYTISPSGRYAFFSFPNNRDHLQTRVNLESGEQRDTWTWLIAELRFQDYRRLSDITADDRYYFLGSRTRDGGSAIHRVDMEPDDFSQAPNISAIEFSPSYLLADETSTVTIRAHVSDAQGLDTISWVRLRAMVDGLEDPEWLVNRPIRGEGSASGLLLYDDGTHGDEVAGDGIFTQDSIRAMLNSNFYDDLTSPRPIGIRVVAKDEDRNYVMADTVLYIAPVGARTEFTVSATSSPGIGGSVLGGENYTLGQQVSLTAVPNPGFVFQGWIENDQVVSTDETYTFMATQDRNLVAAFQRSGSSPGVMMLLLDDAE